MVAAGAMSRWKVGEGGLVERREDGPQPVGPLGMMLAGVVFEERRVADEERRHVLPSSAPRIGGIGHPIRRLSRLAMRR